MIVDGQVQGGVAHGIGNALLEWMQYDDNAQPLTTSFADYLLPMATDVPTCAIAHRRDRQSAQSARRQGRRRRRHHTGAGGDHRRDRRRVVALRRGISPKRRLDARAHRRGVAPVGAYEKLFAA